MKQLETLEKQESKRIPSARRKADKPWTLQRRWQSQADFTKYYHNPTSTFTTDWEDSFDKYMSPKHARQQIEKQMRTHFHGRFRVGRDYRILNKITTQALMVEFIDGKVVINEPLAGAPVVTTIKPTTVKTLEEMTPEELMELSTKLAALQQKVDNKTTT